MLGESLGNTHGGMGNNIRNVWEKGPFHIWKNCEWTEPDILYVKVLSGGGGFLKPINFTLQVKIVRF